MSGRCASNAGSGSPFAHDRDAVELAQQRRAAAAATSSMTLAPRADQRARQSGRTGSCRRDPARYGTAAVFPAGSRPSHGGTAKVRGSQASRLRRHSYSRKPSAKRTEPQQQQAAIPAAFDVARIDSQRGVIARQRLRAPLELDQRRAAIVQHHRIVRTDRQRAVVARDRFLDAGQAHRARCRDCSAPRHDLA